MPLVWFWILGAMLTTYVVLDGFDFGAGTLHLFVAKKDDERRTILAAIGPLWDGNEVWLVASGGLLFFAFPHAYAAATNPITSDDTVSSAINFLNVHYFAAAGSLYGREAEAAYEYADPARADLPPDPVTGLPARKSYDAKFAHVASKDQVTVPIDEDRQHVVHGGRRPIASICVGAPSQFRRLRFADPIDLCGGNAEATDEIVVQVRRDLAAAACVDRGQRAHGQLRRPRNTELAHDEHIERRAQRVGNAGADDHPTAGQAEDQRRQRRVVPEVSGQDGAEQLAGFCAIPVRAHVHWRTPRRAF